MLELNSSCLVVVDLQGKLAQLMHDKETLFKNVQILVKSARILDIPILWCQQVPEVLGPTIPQVAELLQGIEPINKASFSCCGNEQFNSRLKDLNRKQLILCGIETHVCIYQTAVHLLERNYEVAVLADAVSSRTPENKRVGIEKMQEKGIDISSTETVLFELLRTADHPKFRQIAPLLK